MLTHLDAAAYRDGRKEMKEAFLYAMFLQTEKENETLGSKQRAICGTVLSFSSSLFSKMLLRGLPGTAWQAMLGSVVEGESGKVQPSSPSAGGLLLAELDFRSNP